MANERTARLGLPLLHAGQAQKEMTHNEALTRIDLIAQPVVAEAGRNDPPPAPEPGQCWIVGDAPTGDWAGQAHALAGWSAGGWRFVTAFEGMAAWVAGDRLLRRFHGGVWVREKIVGTPAPTVPSPVGGSVIDAEARNALAGVVSVLQLHGLMASEKL